MWICYYKYKLKGESKPKESGKYGDWEKMQKDMKKFKEKNKGKVTFCRAYAEEL